MAEDDFDTYVTSKGYSYFKTEEDKVATKIYAQHQSSSTKASRFIAFTSYNIGNVKLFNNNIKYQTIDKNDYLQIKKQLKTLGFIFLKTSTSDGASFLEYSKGKIELTLISFQGENAAGDFVTGYKIILN